MSVQNREDWMNFEKDRTQVGECSKSDITTNKSDIHTVFVLALIEFTQGGAFLCTKKNY